MAIDFMVVMGPDGHVYVERPHGAEGFAGVIRPQELAHSVVWALWQAYVQARQDAADYDELLTGLEAERDRIANALASERCGKVDQGGL